MYCSKCGAQNPEGITTCQSCGAPLAIVASSPATAVSATAVPSSPPKESSGLAVAALVLGILGFFTGITSVLAIIFGAVAMSQTKKNLNLAGRGMAVAGFVMGIVVVAFGLLFLAFVVFVSLATVTQVGSF